MNWRNIGLFIFFLPLYILVIAVVLYFIYAMAIGLSGLFVFVFLSGWQNFVIAAGLCWALAIVGYLFAKAH